MRSEETGTSRGRAWHIIQSFMPSTQLAQTEPCPEAGPTKQFVLPSKYTEFHSIGQLPARATLEVPLVDYLTDFTVEGFNGPVTIATLVQMLIVRRWYNTQNNRRVVRAWQGIFVRFTPQMSGESKT